MSHRAEALTPPSPPAQAQERPITAHRDSHGHLARLPARRREFSHDVDVVHQPYHVVSPANGAIDAARRDLYRHLQGPDARLSRATASSS